MAALRPDVTVLLGLLALAGLLRGAWLLTAPFSGEPLGPDAFVEVAPTEDPGAYESAVRTIVERNGKVVYHTEYAVFVASGEERLVALRHPDAAPTTIVENESGL